MYDKPERAGPIGPDELSFDVIANLQRSARRCCLPARDVEGLQRHLEYCETAWSGIAALTGEILRHKLRLAQRLAPDMQAGCVASGSSLLGYRIGAQEPQIARLSHRARFWAEAEVVPVRSLLGATLIGMRLGDTAPLLLSDGTFTEVTLVELCASPRERPLARLSGAARPLGVAGGLRVRMQSGS